MYIPEFYKNNNIDEVKSFIVENSFGIMVSQVDNKIVATHIPLLLSKNKSGEDVLLGHISKANQQLKNSDPENEILVIFNGPHTYISSSWYDHENVPTWNYIAVHIYGKLRIIEGEELLSAMDMLVNKFEAGSEHPVSIKKMSPDYLHQHLKGIRGFEIKIERIEAAKKLSQNRDDKNHKKIIEELEKKNDPQANEVAAQMKKTRP